MVSTKTPISESKKLKLQDLTVDKKYVVKGISDPIMTKFGIHIYCKPL